MKQKTTLTASEPCMPLLRETGAQPPATYIIRRASKITTVCSMKFALLILDTGLEGISVHKIVWTINDEVFYWCFTVINFNKIASFRLLICLSLHAPDRQMTQTLRPPMCRK